MIKRTFEITIYGDEPHFSDTYYEITSNDGFVANVYPLQVCNREGDPIIVNGKLLPNDLSHVVKQIATELLRSVAPDYYDPYATMRKETELYLDRIKPTT